MKGAILAMALGAASATLSAKDLGLTPLLPHLRDGIELLLDDDEMSSVVVEGRRRALSQNFMEFEACGTSKKEFNAVNVNSYIEGVVTGKCLPARSTLGDPIGGVLYEYDEKTITYNLFSDIDCTTVFEEVPITTSNGKCNNDDWIPRLVSRSFDSADGEFSRGFSEVRYHDRLCEAPIDYNFVGVHKNTCIETEGDGALKTQDCDDPDVFIMLDYELDGCKGSYEEVETQKNVCVFSEENDGFAIGDQYDQVYLVTERQKGYCHGLRDGDDDDVCFAADSTVTLASGATASLAELDIGDEVLTLSYGTGDIEFSAVVAIPHRMFQKLSTKMSTITTESGRKLVLSPSHLVATTACGEREFSSLRLVEAQDVTSGDCVAVVPSTAAWDLENVVSVTTAAEETPLLSVVTMNGQLLVVNGVAASSFAKVHTLPNMFYYMHRFLYAIGFAGWLRLGRVEAAGATIGAVASMALKYIPSTVSKKKD